MYNPPDRPLVVKCSFDKANKRISFTSARNCNYELLKRKVDQCFALQHQNYAITYKDDDGEVTDINTDEDLREAIQYFQAGNDDALSSATSILSGRSFGRGKITLRVTITVEYDGPSLSDTSSLVSLEEYKGRNRSQNSFSFGSPSVDLDDDSVTVSSRDTGAIPPYGYSNPFKSSQDGRSSANGNVHQGSPTATFLAGPERSSAVSLAIPTPNDFPDFSSTFQGSDRTRRLSSGDDLEKSAASRYPEDPSAVFERLKFEASVSDTSSVNYDALENDDRGAAWLRDQNERAIRAKLGTLPEPSEPDVLYFDGSSLSFDDDHFPNEMDGNLALKRDQRGKYYYSYKSTSSGTSQALDTYDYDSGGPFETDGSFDSQSIPEQPRPTSMQLDWLASQQVSHTPSIYSHGSDRLPSRELHHSLDVPPEVLRFFPLVGPLPDELTDCSACGADLDSFRYVCSTCGPKQPKSSLPTLDKGKGKSSPVEVRNGYVPEHQHTYPPMPFHLGSSPSYSCSSQTLVADTESAFDPDYTRQKPLPSLPQISSGHSSSSGSSTSAHGPGYELCSGCIESVGPMHAVEGMSGLSQPSSPDDLHMDISEIRRSAPKQKGQLRHAYQEKIWTHRGWEDVEHEESQTSKCTFCPAVNLRRSFKCASCPNLNMCRACYSQVHELHPSHAFLVVPDRRTRSSDSGYKPIAPDPCDEESMKHPGVKCHHCLQDIVGARFHCAICDEVDICSNCESAGLPGNLDSTDGSHSSSHIMIKIPYPVGSAEVQTASRRAINLWRRDAANVSQGTEPSLASSYAHSAIVSARGEHPTLSPPDDHNILCRGCNKPIIGIRYQCASCPSIPAPYSLCAQCEERSYSVHNSWHIFFKLPRPVDHQISSQTPIVPTLYQEPVARDYTSDIDPKGYLQYVMHGVTLCDCCTTHINGEWFRCVYCARDLCSTCEAIDDHDDTHFFLIFKAPVDMNSLKSFLQLDKPDRPPIIKYAAYDKAS